MHKLTRAAAAMATGLLLLAAGKAPDTTGDLFANADTTAVVPAVERISAPQAMTAFPTAPDATVDELPAMIEEPYQPTEPDIGPVLPDAATLSDMVRRVRAQLTAEPAVMAGADLECLAIAVYFESKGEPLEGQLAVAQVILNRVDRGRFGRDACGVVKAPSQFGFVRAGRFPEPVNREQWLTARAVALIAASQAWPGMVGDATHFHATRVNPGWRMQRVAAIGGHIFYR